MTFNPDDILIVCCHIKKNFFFEDSLRRLYDAGFHRIWIQQTGTNTFGDYGGPAEYYWPAPHTGICAWETGLKCLQNHTLEVDNWKYLFLADFDLFFLGASELVQCIDEVIEGGYDHVSRLKNRLHATEYNWGNHIVTHVPNVRVDPGNTDFDWPLITPHFATGYQFFSQRLWNSYTDYELSDGRRHLRKAIEMGYKMGAQFANYGPGEQCWGKEWFHVSNLTYFFHMVDGTCPSTLNLNNHEHLWRMGFFVAQEEIYGSGIYPPLIKNSLEKLWNDMGGRSRCYDAWIDEIAGKPMERWSRYD